jgi:hypothetical protein
VDPPTELESHWIAAQGRNDGSRAQAAMTGSRQ